MTRLKLFIIIFFIAVSVPLAYVIWRTYVGLEQEERGQLQFFSETLLDQMERELAELVQVEENRSVDEYQYYLAQSTEQDSDGQRVSPLARSSYREYILGYLQNNPDGSFQTPVVADMGNVPEERQELVSQLREINRIFNTKKFSLPRPVTAAAPTETEDEAKSPSAGKAVSFSERYLARSKSENDKAYLGKKQQRVEEISAEQVLNIASEDESLKIDREIRRQTAPAAVSEPNSVGTAADMLQEQKESGLGDSGLQERDGQFAQPLSPRDGQAKFQVEVAPFQSVSIREDQVYIFRRIAINNQIYRQGFILLAEPFLNHLVHAYFTSQPLAAFTSLAMQRRDLGEIRTIVQAGISGSGTDFLAERIFPAPFDFLSVSLKARSIPPSPARVSLNAALVVLGIFMLLGLLAIYQSARTIVLMSERRSQFVSSVTHELKTPLTNIRMYIEMLEQGIASSPEREQEYLEILNSESARLSSLINNVLELAKLEKKQRHFHLQNGRLADVLPEVETIMAQKLNQEGFSLQVRAAEVPLFPYDREVMIQILINLIENSIKFGRSSAEKSITITVEGREDMVHLAVSDTGPGIPRSALRKIFDDFYRVDNKLTRSTGGTGIGLALVKKFVSAMGGKVYAVNNEGPGCTIILLLKPAKA